MNILDVQNLTLSFGENTLFSNLSFQPLPPHIPVYCASRDKSSGSHRKLPVREKSLHSGLLRRRERCRQNFAF